MIFLCIISNVRQLLKPELIINEKLNLSKYNYNLWREKKKKGGTTTKKDRGLPATAAFSQQFESVEGQAAGCQALILKHSLPASSLPPANRGGEECQMVH